MLTSLWMQRDIISVDTETTLAQAKEIFDQSHFRHLPVVAEEILVGIVTQNDINRALPSALDSSFTPEHRIIAAQVTISSIMTTDPLTASPMDPLEKVAMTMHRFKINAVPVVKEKARLMGIITTTDIVNAFAETLGVVNDQGSTRIEMQINKNSTDIYKVIEIFSDFDMDLSAITLYKNYSPQHQLLTVKVAGENIDEMVDALWSSGARVDQVAKD